MSYEVRNKLLEKQRAAGYPGGTEDNKKQYTSVRERLLSKTTEENIRSARKKVSDWADKYNSVMKGVSDYQSKLKGGYTKDASGGYAKAIDELVRDYDGIKSYANRMGLPNAQRYLKQLQQMQRGIRETNAYMSQFLDEADYNHKASRDNRLAALKQYDVASNEATSKRLNDAIVEASGIREQLGIYQNDALTRLTQRNKVDALQKRLDDITKEFGSLDEMKARASVLQQDLMDAKRVQEGMRMAENAKADRDFDTLGSVNMANTDAKYRYINDENYRRQYDAMVQNNAMEGHKPVNNFSEAGLDLMNSEERQLYNYYWAKGGSEAAESYLDSIREELNSRKARTIYEDLSGDEWMDTAMKYAYAGEASVGRWQDEAKGAFDMISGKDSYVPVTAKQMASSMVREDLEDVGPKLPEWLGGASLGQSVYDAIGTTAYMAPSILASTVANVVAPGSGQVVSNVMMGASALGGAYQEALNRGYDKYQAGMYASMIAASEVGLNYMLGGISKLGGVVTNGAVEAMLSKVDNAILRTAGKIGGNMLSEGLEEGLQEIMTTWFSNIALGTSEKVSWDQVLYSGLMGSLTAGVFEGTDVISGEVNANTQGKDLKARGVTGAQLAELDKTFDIGSKARELAERVNDSTDAYTMGRLFREVGAGLSDQNKADIAQSLMDKGMSQELAVKHAEIMEYIVEGGEVSNLQMKMIQKNDVLAETMREVILNENSVLRQRSGTYNEIKENTAGNGGVWYRLNEYSARQKENWKNSKRIVLYEGEGQFRQFIENALNNKVQTNKKMYFGAIPTDFAVDIKKATGIDVEGYNLSLAENEIRKIRKSHGDAKAEALRGQRAVTMEDYLNIPNVVQSPDNISRSRENYEGKPVIEFRKRNGNEITTVVAVVSDKHLDLFVQTSYINKKTGSIATPESVQADSFTSETPGGTAPTLSVSQNIAEVNVKNETGSSRGDGHQENLTDVQPSYGGTPISENRLAQQGMEVNRKSAAYDGDSTSNRTLLVNAHENSAQTQEERLKLREYRKEILKVEDMRKRLDGIHNLIQKESSGNGDIKKIRQLVRNATDLAEVIDSVDKKVIPKLEVSAPLQAVLKREKDYYTEQEAQRKKESEDIIPKSVGAAAAKFDPITHWQYEYGTIPEGENPVRPDDLPVSTDGENKVSYTARTVKGAKVTPEEFVGLLEQDIVNGGLTYMPIANDDTTRKAINYITNHGWVDAKAKWTADVRAGKASAEMSAIGALLLNNAAKAGDREAWLDILHDYQHMGTNAGQAIQALRILKKLTPDDKLYMAQRSIDQMVEDMHLGTEITLDEDLKNEFLEAETDEKRNEIMSQIQQNVADQLPATFMEKWTALRYLNMLGNLRTQIRNLTGNLGMKAVVSLKNGIATGLEQLAYKASGETLQRTKSFTVSKEMMKAAREDFALVESLIQGGGKYSDAQSASAEFAKAVQEKRTIFKSRFLERYRKTTNWAMDAGDVLFSQTAYARALAGYLKVNGVKTSDFSKVDAALMDEARLYAVQEAQEATFRDTNWLSGWLSKIGRRPDTPAVGKVLSEGIMPFRKTPANVLIRAEEYSPLGIVNSLVLSVQAMQKKADVTGNQVINSWAKSLTGTMLFGLGMLMHSMGLLIGGPDDDEALDRFEELNGWQNYALKFGDITLTIDFLSPAAMPMFVGAQLNKMRQDGGIEIKEIEKAITSLTDPMIQMSMLQGVNDTLENIRYAESNTGQLLINIVTSYLTQGLTSTLVGQLERSFEDRRMSTYVDADSAIPSWLQRTLGKASAKTPGLDYNQIPYINAWGEEEKNPTALLNLLYNLLSPSYVSKVEEDAVSQELTRLNGAQSDINVFPNTPKKTVKFTDSSGEEHEEYNLSADEYVALAREQGQTQRRIIESMTASELYKDIPDKYKAKAVQFAYEYAREHAQIEVLDRDGFSSDWMAEIKGDTAEGILKHVIGENVKGMYLNGDITAGEAMKRLVLYKGYDGGAAADKVAYWDFQADNPQYSDWEESTVIKYKELDADSAARVIDLLDKLGPEDGFTDVRPVQKYEAIVNDNRLSDSEKDTALRAVMDDKMDEKYDTARDMGMNAAEFTQAYRKYQDTSGKGKKKAVTAWYAEALGLSKSDAEDLYDLFAGKKEK